MAEMQVQVIRSSRKTLALTLQKDGTPLVRAPYSAGDRQIRNFVESHLDWIQKHQKKCEDEIIKNNNIPKLSSEELKTLAKTAMEDFSARVRYFAPRIGVSFGRITVRNQKSKWGSCSSKGNLNFNCLLMLAPEEIRDYVVVHELCHRIEMNHSWAFWARVKSILPDYEKSRRWLREHGSELMQRNPVS